MKTVYEQLLRASPAPCQPCQHGQPEWAEEMGRMGEARRWESWDRFRYWPAGNKTPPPCLNDIFDPIGTRPASKTGS